MNDPQLPGGLFLPSGKHAPASSLHAEDTNAKTSSPQPPSTPGGERKRRSRHRRRRRPGADDASTGATRGAHDLAATSVADSTATREPLNATPPRSRRRRRKKTGTARASGAGDERPSDAHASAHSNGGPSPDGSVPPRAKRRRRGSRGGRRKKVGAALIDAIPGEEDEFLDLEEFARQNGVAAAPGPTPKPSSRSARQESDDDLDEGERGGVSREKQRASEEAERTQVLLVNAADAREVRVAIVEDEKILDFQMTVDRYNSLVNDIYRGRVVNIEAPIGAAFIDFGQGRNGFLHSSDVLSAYGDPDWKLEKLLTTRVAEEEWSSESDTVDTDNEKAAQKKARPHRRSRPRLPITDLFKKGQMVAVQITKDAIGDKGPTLTTYISIPGRYLVLMPSLARTGVSRKIEDDKERRRLKRILATLDIPEGMGVIVRTAGVGKTKTELKRDLEYLMAVWDDFGRRLVSGRNPAPLYQESSVAIRTMRDLFSSKTKSVVVDDPEVHAEMVEFAERLMPEHVERIVLHDKQRPLFHAYGVEQEFERMFARRVELPSGGSIVFDQTEALVAIDVNSGRTREEGAGFEDIALKTNLEAAPEIARQIRLRDLGGIIVIDFIDMLRQGNRRNVERAFRNLLATDRARSKLGRISQFGLLEMTRQRLGPGLSKLIYDSCSYCRGTGRQRTPASRAQAIVRRLGSALTQKGFTTVEVRALPEVIQYLQEQLADELAALSELHSRELKFSKVPGQTEDSVLRYLRADGREVRPGGRRKR